VALAGVNAKTANYTLVLGDAGDLVTMSSTSARTITVPTNTSVAFPTGTIIYLTNINTGAVTVAGASGVTVNAQGTLRVLQGQFSSGVLMKYGTDAWLLTILTRGMA
jgi:hypothetical protein